MKKMLALLALSSATSLVADSCCQPCEPCCTPQPRAPINCECYTPAFDDMQCDWGMFFDVEFLYWYGRENDMAYAYVGKTVQSNTSTVPYDFAPQKYKHIDTKWDPGVRVGLGWKAHDGWDLSAYWTYYHSEKGSSVSVAPFAGEIPDLGNSGIVNLFQDYAVANFFLDQLSAKWDFHINQIDLVMGRKYYLSKWFVMRPYMGLRGAWSRTSFSTEGNTSTTGISVTELEGHFINKNWGVGFVGGFQPSWYFDEEFSLYGDASFALLWGQFKQNHNDTYNFTIASGLTGLNAGTYTYNNTATDNFYGMQPVMDLALGLRWETNWCEDRYAFMLDAGWEHHMWFNYNTRTKVTHGHTTTTYADSSGTANAVAGRGEEKIYNVEFGGFVLRARFDF